MQNDFSKRRFRTLARLFHLACVATLVSCYGCGANPEPKEVEETEEVVYAPNPIKMLVVGDDVIGPRIVRQWKARRDGVIELETCTQEEFFESDLEVPEGVDVVIYPVGFLGGLAEAEKIVEVPKTLWASDDFNKNELLKHFRLSTVRYANEPWALPLGGSHMVMFCDRETFEKAGVSAPETWEKVESRLSKLGPDSSIKIDMPMAQGWAATSFLARLAPSIRHRGSLSTVFERKTMEPLIDRKSFAEALSQLKRVASKRSLELTPAAVYDLAVNGESPISFCWPVSGNSNAQATDEEREKSIENDGLDVFPLPGVKKWYDHEANVWNKRTDVNEVHVDLAGFHGLLASVSSDANDPDTAWEFLEWLPSKSISLLTLADSPNSGPFRASHLGDVARWTGERLSMEVLDQYADVLAESHRRPMILMFPRIPGHLEYFNALDEGVRDYMVSDRSAEDVLAEVAGKWEAITERLGRIQQVKALRKDSGF